MSNHHLLPCPFCGCTKVPNRQGNGIGDYWLECFECGASTRLREDGAGMEKDWNRRPPAAQQPSGEVTDDDKVCAERYRWLRARMAFVEGPNAAASMSMRSSIPAPNHDFNADFVGDRFDASVDAAIDAAMAVARAQGGES
ncbi:hypothetical protein C6P96_04810 [Burkholderia multivorans]|uniref:Lar family restriction alleviation protein n=1 Tax=Burkholderia multivorans TaxID=87883 RepID=UPI000CFF5EF3|nr:Lar family restriction alleviation protein [Burkholderia multivorans]PRE60559.1 hypothetical protein C6P95_25130 [Burkholderia multivorans]PRF16457.1 hypothetical protein C6P96_04810 [Burkholderia multivorans]